MRNQILKKRLILEKIIIYKLILIRLVYYGINYIISYKTYYISIKIDDSIITFILNKNSDKYVNIWSFGFYKKILISINSKLKKLINKHIFIKLDIKIKIENLSFIALQKDKKIFQLNKKIKKKTVYLLLSKK